jgi:hypothetical protein
MKTLYTALALALAGCSLGEEPCRDPESIALVATDRTATCDPPFETREGMLHCEQLDGQTDSETCEFRGSAVCTDGIRAALQFSLAPGERSTGTAVYRAVDGCTVTANLRERE